jgi:hypothetical protein
LQENAAYWHMQIYTKEIQGGANLKRLNASTVKGVKKLMKTVK